MNLRPFIAALIAVSFVASPFIAAADATSSVINVDTTSQQMLINQLEAQLASLKAQLAYLLSLRANATSSTAVAPAAPSGVLCVTLSRTLSVGMQGDDVTLLQKALATDASIYPTGQVTGYFGSATQAAVMNLQTRYNILVDGVATGIVGPQTRAFLAARCAKAAQGTTAGTPNNATNTNGGNNFFSNIFGPQQGTSNTTTRLSSAPTSTGQVLTDVFRWVTAAPATTTPGASVPVISSFNGPTHLSINQVGTWTINATDPKGEALTYSVSWGDATSSASSALMALASGSTENTSTIPSFQHGYSSAAVFPVSVAVRNTDGVAVSASAIVLVSNQGGNSVSDVLQEISNGSTTYTNLLNDLAGIPSSNANNASTTNPWADTTSWLTGGTFCSMFPSLCTFLGTSTIQSTLQNNNPYANITPDGTGAGNTSTGNTTGLPGYAQTMGQSCSPSGTFTAVWAAPGLLVSSSSGKYGTSTGSIIQLQCTGGRWVDPLASAPSM